MTVCRLSGPYFHSCSACCFGALQTDAPSNLFIHGWAMGVMYCHSMASTQRHPMSFTTNDVCSVCVCMLMNICQWALFLSLLFFINSVCQETSNMSMCIHLSLKMTQCCKALWSFLRPWLHFSNFLLSSYLSCSQSLGFCYQSGLYRSMPKQDGPKAGYVQRCVLFGFYD